VNAIVSATAIGNILAGLAYNRIVTIFAEQNIVGLPAAKTVIP